MLTLEEGARRVVQTCAGVRPDERALVLYDQVDNAEPAWALRRAASMLGASVHVRYLERTPADGDVLAQVADELADLDLVITFTRGSAWSSPAANRTAAAGCRLFTMAGADGRTLTRGAIEADFAAVAPTCEFLADRLDEAVDAEISTSAGTKLRMSLGGRAAVPNPPTAPRPGVFRAPYAGVFTAPVPGTVEGTVVVDASTSLGLVDSPVTIVLEHGRAISVTGGGAAHQVERALDGAGGVVDVLGFGLNPAARLTGSIAQDASVAGTGHLSLALPPDGGGLPQVELVYSKPTLLLNGTEIIGAGVLR